MCHGEEGDYFWLVVFTSEMALGFGFDGVGFLLFFFGFWDLEDYIVLDYQAVLFPPWPIPI